MKELPTSYTLDGIYLLKVGTRNTRKRYEICVKLAMKKPELMSLLSSNIFHN